jgi:hypothetical protein
MLTMSASEPIRLQKFIADAGMCSRRAAEALIAQGEVWVNGSAATLGQKITPGVDKVTVSGKTVRTTAQPRITVAVHYVPTMIRITPRRFSTCCRVSSRNFGSSAQAVLIWTVRAW